MKHRTKDFISIPLFIITLPMKLLKFCFKFIQYLFPKIRKRKRLSRFLTITGTIIIFLIPLLGIFFARSQKVEAAWMDELWRFRKKIPVTAHTAEESNVYFTVTLDTSDTNKFQTDCGDLRFTKQNGQLLPYYISSGCSTASTSVNVLVDTFPAGAQDFWVYYGNPQAPNGFSASNFPTAASNVTLGSVGSEEKTVGPVGWWKLDEGTGTTVYDATGKINGTLGGTIDYGGGGGSNIIRTEINILNSTSTTSTATDLSEKIRIDTTKYSGTVTYYFEVVVSGNASNTGTITLRRNATTTDDATITVGTNTSYTRIRSTAFTPPAGQTTYFVRNNADGTRSQSVKAARVIIIQNDSSGLYSTQQQFEIGNYETGKSNTSTAALDNPKYWTYNSSNWSPTPTFYAEAVYKSGGSLTPTFVQSKSAGLSGNNGVSVTLDSTPTTYNLLVAAIATDGNNSMTISNWNALTDCTTGGGGSSSIRMFWKISDGTESTITSSTANAGKAMAVAEYSNIKWDFNTLLVQNCQINASGTYSTPTVNASEAGLAVFATFVEAGAANNWSAEQINASATGVTEREDVASGPSLQLSDKLSASSGNNQGTATSAATDNGGGAIAMFTIQSPQTSIYVQEDDGSYANWTNVTNGTITSTGESTTPFRVRTSSGFTPTSGRHYRLAAKTNASGGTYDIYAAKIIADQLGSETNTYYFNASDAGPTDPNTVWSFDSNAFDGSTSTTANTSTFGSTSSNYLTGTGTTAPTSGNTIISVQARAYGSFTGTYDLTTPTARVYSGAESLGGALIVSATAQWNTYYTMNTPTGGWTWQKINDLEARIYAAGLTITDLSVYRVEILVTSAVQITTTQSEYIVANTGSIGGSTGLKDFDTYWDPAEWSGVTNTYYHEGNGVSSGTGDMKLQSDPNGTPADVTNSTITDTIEVELSSAMTMPVAAATLDVNVTGTGTINASKIVVVSAISAISSSSTTVSAPTWKSSDVCLTQYCTYFPGSDAGIVIDNTSIIDFDTGLSGGFTIAMWLKANNAGEGSDGYIFSKGTSTYLKVGNLSSGVMDVSGSFDLATTDATTSVTGGITQNKWHHVAMTASSTTIKIYIDGKLRATSSNGSGAFEADTNDLAIGHKAGTGGTWQGFIDDVRVYNYARTDAQINSLATFPNGGGKGSVLSSAIDTNTFLHDGLLGYWNLNESSGTAADSSGNALTLTNNGTTTYVTGKYGNGSEHVPASSQYLSTATTISGVKTISLWVNPDSTTNYYINLTASIGLTSSTGTLAVSGASDATIYVNGTPSTTIAADTWQLITVTMPTSVDANQFYVGRVGSNYYDGTIDDVRLFNRILSPGEIRQLYDWSLSPVAYWNFDESSGQTVTDSSVNASNGNLGATSSEETTDPKRVKGKFGNALEFDGTDDKVTVGDQSVFDSMKIMSVSAWVYVPTYNVNYKRIVTKTDGGEADGFVFDLSSASQKLRFRINNNDCESNSSTTQGTWYHAAGTYDGANIRVYINGLLDKTCAYTTAMTANNSNLVIGDRSDGNSRFYGSLDDVRIYNYARSAQQIIEDMNQSHPIGGSPIGSQVLYWRFDEGQGTTANSAVSGRQNGTLTNIASPATSTSGWTYSGKYSKAIVFDGSNDNVALATASDADVDFATTEPFTLSAWIYMTSDPASTDNDLIIGKWDANSTQRAYRLILKNDDDDDTTAHIQAEIYDQSTTQTITAATANDSISPNTWYHVAMTFNGGVTGAAGDLTVYINGQKKNTNAANASFLGLEDLAADFTVGDYDANDSTSGNTAFTGLIDEVQVYSAALTEAQMKIVYNANAGISVANDATKLSENAGGAGNPGVGYWPLDENTGTSTTYDKSGNERNGTLNGDIKQEAWVRGKYGAALKLDGSDDEIVIADGSSFSTNSYTVSAWVYRTTDSGANEHIFDNRDANDDGFRIVIDGTTDRFECAYNATDSVSSAGTAALNTWIHIMCMSDGSTQYLFVNGSLEDSDAITGSIAETTNATIGGISYGTGSNFPGYVDNVLLYDYARSPAQRFFDYNQGKPIFHWKFDECSGTTAYESANPSRVNNGTITPGGAPNSSAGTCSSGTSSEMWNDGTTGKMNASLGFDGTDDYVVVTHNASQTFNAAARDFSIYAWVKRSTTGTEYIISKEDADDDGWRMQFNSSNQVLCSVDAIDITSSSSITDTAWHHVGCSIDRDANGQVYIDGKADGSAVAISSEVMSVSSNIRIGTRSYTSTNYFNGLIDDIRIYPWALSAAEVRRSMNEDSPLRFGPETGEP